MNERLLPVGRDFVLYFANKADADIGWEPSKIASINSYTLDTVQGISFWKVSGSSSGLSPQNISFPAGYTLDPSGYYNVYPGSGTSPISSSSISVAWLLVAGLLVGLLLGLMIESILKHN